MTSAITVAGYIKKACDLQYQEREQLQKLTYFVQAWYLAWTGRPLFEDAFQAWPRGPVEPEVFRLSKFGQLPSEADLDEDKRCIIDDVLAYYGPLDREKLVALTHADAPWIEARRGLRPEEHSERELSMKTMLDFYTAQALSGMEGPKRSGVIRPADDHEVTTSGAQVIERWREGLALLAQK